MLDVSTILSAIVGYMSGLFTILLLICLYAAYEFNRRLYFIKKSHHQHTYKLFNSLRFLFLFMSIYFATHLIQGIYDGKVEIVYLFLAIFRITAYIGIAVTVMSMALSPVLTLGRSLHTPPENE